MRPRLPNIFAQHKLSFRAENDYIIMPPDDNFRQVIDGFEDRKIQGKAIAENQALKDKKKADK